MGAKNRIGLVVFALIILAMPYIAQGSFYKLIPIGIFTLITIGLSLLLGYAGQISLGHAAFYAIGAYTSGIMTVKYGWSPWLAIALGIALSCTVALIVGLPSLRLRGHYLAMATLAFGEIIKVTLDAWDSMTSGPSGFGGIPSLEVFGFTFDPIMDEKSVFYLVWGCAFFGLVAALRLIHSRFGRALRSIHDNEQAADVLGVPTASCKVKVFVLSAAYASLAGSLYAHYIGFINPPPFGVMTSILVVVMVIVGGMRTVWGAVVGALIMGMLPEWFSAMENYYHVVYGAIVLLIMMFLRQGVLLGLRDLAQWIWNKIRPRRKEQTP
jgi:branched-chain amino acid transport system permease protein